MKLIRTLNEGSYVNIEYIKYIYISLFGGKIAYYISIGDNKECEISEDVYNYLISNYYE